MRKVISYQLSVVSLIVACLTACIPVEKPPQLTFTPGMSFSVTDETFDAGVFRVNYPTGWRVITGQASAPPSVIFAAPDDMALIMLAVSGINAPPTLNTGVEMRSESRSVALEELTIAAYLTAPADQWDSFVQTFEAVIESVE